MIRALALLTMLLPTDSAAIQGSRLLPNAQAALNSTLTVRAATLVKPLYFKYTGPTSANVIQYDFAPNTIATGTQVFIHLYGSLLNNDAADIDFSPIVSSTNAGLVDNILPVAWTTPPQPGSVAWQLDVTLSANPVADPDFTLPQPPMARSNSPSATRLRWSGMMSLTQTDITASGAGTSAMAGGNPLAGTGANQSLMVSTTGVAPIVTFDPALTTRTSVGITIGKLGEFTVQGGWLEVR